MLVLAVWSKLIRLVKTQDAFIYTVNVTKSSNVTLANAEKLPSSVNIIAT